MIAREPYVDAGRAPSRNSDDSLVWRNNEIARLLRADPHRDDVPVLHTEAQGIEAILQARAATRAPRRAAQAEQEAA